MKYCFPLEAFGSVSDVDSRGGGIDLTTLRKADGGRRHLLQDCSVSEGVKSYGHLAHGSFCGRNPTGAERLASLSGLVKSVGTLHEVIAHLRNPLLIS